VRDKVLNGDPVLGIPQKLPRMKPGRNECAGRQADGDRAIVL